MAGLGPARDPNGRGPAGILRRAAELVAADQPFALATVVAIQRPTSARPGAHGIVHADRSVEGWVGGSCARPIVIREALRSLEDGRPRLLRLSKDPPSESTRDDGVVEYLMACHSGGTLEIFVEPHLPAPALWVLGTTPIASALVDLGAAGGFRVSVVDEDARTDAFPAADRVLNTSDLASIEAASPPYVVIATQGQWDEEALEAALRRDCAYVGLVASPKRAAVMRNYLRDQGVAEDRIAALRGPAGLDVGAETPEEIAISILAELVQVRRRRSPAAAVPVSADAGAQRPAPSIDFSDAAAPALAAGPGRPGAEAASPSPSPATAPASTAPDPGEIVLLDPVCAMTVEREDVRYIAEHAGIVYAFCSLTCRNRFSKDPTAYLGAAPSSVG